MLKHLAWLSLALAGILGAQPIGLDEQDPAAMAAPAAKLSAALKKGEPLQLPLKALVPRKPGGAWEPEALSELLASSEPFVQEDAAAGQGWVMRRSPVRLLLVENQSTVKPISEQLPAWSWPFRVLDFSDLERSPEIWLNPLAWGFVPLRNPGNAGSVDVRPDRGPLRPDELGHDGGASSPLAPAHG
jgi:hypothetical protein